MSKQKQATLPFVERVESPVLPIPANVLASMLQSAMLDGVVLGSRMMWPSKHLEDPITWPDGAFREGGKSTLELEQEASRRAWIIVQNLTRGTAA